MPSIPPPPLAVAISRLGVACRSSRGGLGADPDAVAEARSDVLAARLARQINEALTAQPPLTLDQRNHLASLLASGRPA